MLGTNKKEPTTEFEKSMLLLENDLDAYGWDQPPRLYAIMGDEDDWRMDLVTTMQGHPVDFMRMMVATGHFADEVKGVAVATEGWRHPTWDETKVKHPDMLAKIMAAAEELGIPEKEADERASKVYYESLGRPSEHPERVEIRNIMVVMRDGRSMGVHRDRDGEAELLDGMGEGRVIEAMQATLTGYWPKGLMSWAQEDDSDAMEEGLSAVLDSIRESVRKRLHEEGQ